MATLEAKKNTRQQRRFVNKANRHAQRTANAVLTKIGNIRTTRALSVLAEVC